MDKDPTKEQDQEQHRNRSNIPTQYLSTYLHCSIRSPSDVLSPMSKQLFNRKLSAIKPRKLDESLVKSKLSNRSEDENSKNTTSE